MPQTMSIDTKTYFFQDGFVIIWDLQKKSEIHRHRYADESNDSVAIVTRMFVHHDKIFLFFKK